MLFDRIRDRNRVLPHVPMAQKHVLQNESNHDESIDSTPTSYRRMLSAVRGEQITGVPPSASSVPRGQLRIQQR